MITTIVLVAIQTVAMFLIWRHGIRTGYNIARAVYHRTNIAYLEELLTPAPSHAIVDAWDDQEPPLWRLNYLPKKLL